MDDTIGIDFQNNINYVISSRDFDMSSLALRRPAELDSTVPLWSSTSRHTNEYLEFQIFGNYEDGTHKDENIPTQDCHICDIQVPLTFLNEHNNSLVHQAYSAIVDLSLERIRRQMSLTHVPDTNSNRCFCHVCSITMSLTKKDDHLIGEDHKKNILKNSLINELAAIFKSETNFDTSLKNIKQLLNVNADDLNNQDIKVDANDLNNQNDDRNIDDDLKVNDDLNQDYPNAEKEKQYLEDINKIGGVTVDYCDKDHVLIKLDDGDTLKVSNDNFHGFIRFADKISLCQLCQKPVSNWREHRLEKDHMTIVSYPVYNYVRDVDNATVIQHCIVCNEIIIDLAFHLVSNLKHNSLIEKALIKKKPVDRLKLNIVAYQDDSNEEEYKQYLDDINKMGGVTVAYCDKDNVLIELDDGDMLKVPNDYFHGFVKSAHNFSLCQLCQKPVGNWREHRLEKDHMTIVSYPVRNYVRDVDEATVIQHCIVCNEIIINLEFHKRSQFWHNVMLGELLIKKKKKRVRSRKNKDNNKKKNHVDDLLENMKVRTVESFYKNSSYYCGLCDVDLNEETARKHIDTDIHNRDSIELTPSTASVPDPKLNPGIKTFCPDCKLWCSISIAQHIQSPLHKYRNQLTKNNPIHFHMRKIDQESVFCKICKLTVDKTEVGNHVESIAHTALYANFVTANDFAVVDDIEITCNLCCTSDFIVDAFAHSEKKVHKLKLANIASSHTYALFLINNNLREVDDGLLYCRVCMIDFIKTSVVAHIQSEKHTASIIKLLTENDSKETQEKVNDEEPAEASGDVDEGAKKVKSGVGYIFEVDYFGDFEGGCRYRCKVCDIYLGRYTSRTVHRKDPRHIRRLDALRLANGLTRVATKTHCNLCEVSFKTSEELIHIESSEHSERFKEEECTSEVDNLLNSSKSTTEEMYEDADDYDFSETDNSNMILENKDKSENIESDLRIEAASIKKLIKNETRDGITPGSEVASCFDHLLETKGKQVICKICESFIGNRTDLIDEHMNGTKHGSKYEKFLVSNCLSEVEDDVVEKESFYFCKACVSDVLNDDLFCHLNSSTHKQVMLKISERNEKSQSELKDSNPLKSLPDKEESDLVWSHKVHFFKQCGVNELHCIICLIELDSSAKSFKQHVYSKSHSDNIECFLRGQEINKVDGRYFCSLCEIVLENGTQIHHAHTNQHKNNFITFPVRDSETETYEISKSYICTVCGIEMTDNAKNIKIHEEGARHKANLAKIDEEVNRQLQGAIGELRDCVKMFKEINNSNAHHFDSHVNSVAKDYQVQTVKINPRMPLGPIKVTDKNFIPSRSKQIPEKAIVDGFCTVCRVNVPPDARNIIDHMNGSKHKAADAIIKGNTTAYKDNYFENGRCTLCQVYVGTDSRSISAHNDGIQHRHNITHRTKTKDAQAAVTNTHNKLILKPEVGTVEQTVSKVSSTQSVAKADVKESVIKVGNKTEMSVQPQAKTIAVKGGFCTVCKVKVPNNPSNIADHIQGFKHQAALADANAVPVDKYIKDGFCTLCQTSVNLVNLLGTNPHNESYQHLRNLANVNRLQDGIDGSSIEVDEERIDKVKNLTSTSSLESLNSILDFTQAGTSKIKTTAIPSTSGLQDSKSAGITTYNLPILQGITAEGASYNCKLCNVEFPKLPSCLMDHLNGKNHKKCQERHNTLNTNDASSANTSQTTKDVVVSAQNVEQKEPTEHMCEICQVKVPNTIHNIKQHENGGRHKTNLEKNIEDGKALEMKGNNDAGLVNTTNQNVLPNPIKENTVPTLVEKYKEIKERNDGELFNTTNVKAENERPNPMKENVVPILVEKNKEKEVKSDGELINTTNVKDENVFSNSIKNYGLEEGVNKTKEILDPIIVENIKEIDDPDVQHAISASDSAITHENNDKDGVDDITKPGTSKISTNLNDNESETVENIPSNSSNQVTDGNMNENEGLDLPDAEDNDESEDEAGFFICKVCERSIRNTPADRKYHFTTYYHNTKLIEKRESLPTENVKANLNDKTFCKICNLFVDNVSFKLHFKSPSHKSHFEKLVIKHGIRVKNNICHCALCNLSFNKYTVADHIDKQSHRVRHASELLTNNSQKVDVLAPTWMK